MRFVKLLACAAALLTAATASIAVAGDPWDDARYAIKVKDTAGALTLIDSGAFDVNMQNGEGYTLLHIAADDGNLAMVNALLERGADPAIKTNRGSTALDLAMGTMVAARIRKAMTPAPLALAAPAPAAAVTRSAAAVQPVAKPKPAPAATPESPHRKMCNARHYSSSALCSDTTCKMREYRKWNTCLKTGSYI